MPVRSGLATQQSQGELFPVFSSRINSHGRDLHDLTEQRESGPKYKTRSGIRVRSKIEKIIADFLLGENIRFIYEPRVQLDEFEITPDFYLPDHNLFYEHFGLNTPAYRQAAELKIATYHRAGVRCRGKAAGAETARDASRQPGFCPLGVAEGRPEFKPCGNVIIGHPGGRRAT